MTPSANRCHSVCPSRIFPWAAFRIASPTIVFVDDRQINNSYHPGWRDVSVAVVDDIGFHRGHTHPRALWRCHSLPHTLTGPGTLTCSKKKKKSFHDIIGFIRSRPKWDCGPVAGLVSMLSSAEGAALDQNAALLLLYSQFPSLCICASEGLSQQGLTKLMSWLQGQCSASNIAVSLSIK